MAEPLPTPSTTPKADTKRTTTDTGKNVSNGLSVSAYIVRILQAEPTRVFLVKDIVDLMEGKRDTITRTLLRLSSTGKGSGPVHKVGHGMYQYDPLKESNSLHALARSGNWKIENLVFVRLEAHPTPMSNSETQATNNQTDTLDPRITTPHPKCPFLGDLTTGHLVTWENYDNGTLVIYISANGALPTGFT